MAFTPCQLGNPVSFLESSVHRATSSEADEVFVLWNTEYLKCVTSNPPTPTNPSPTIESLDVEDNGCRRLSRIGDGAAEEFTLLLQCSPRLAP